MSLKLGTQDISGISLNTKYNAHHLLDFKWSDCIMNDVSWLRADTFSWQSGDVYVSAYNHLVADLQGTTAQTETIGSYTITFYRADDGHKIVLADQETIVANIYSETGIAWYYILDTVNTQFKLPRTKYGFEGLRNSVGDNIDESLPNITGYFYGEAGLGNPTGAFYAGNNPYRGSTSGSTNNQMLFDASRSSSTYQDNAPVQERATQMYLYFYVGDFSQTATEQTAGLNSELFNGKADVDLSNLSSGLSNTICTTTPTTVSSATSATPAVVIENYVNGDSWYRVWSDGYKEQGGRATGTPNFTIYFLKSFSNTNYTMLTTTRTGSGDYTVRTMEIILQNVTASSVILQSCPSFNGTQFYWYACGY